MSPTPYYSDDLVTLYHGDCRDECLAAALQEEVDADRSRPYGIRGGATAADRDRIAKRRRGLR